MIHIPILRWGEAYYSLKRSTLRDIRTGEPVAEMSLANGGLIGRDLGQVAECQRRLAAVGCEELVEICGRAAKVFVEGELPLGEGVQSPEEYIAQLSATTGMPQSLCRRNSEKIRLALSEMGDVLDGLTRGMNLSVLDAGWGTQEGRTVSYLRQADALGAVLPNNSPGVHSLWLPAIPLKVPLALKPGSEEPWTPYRIAQAFISAGCPPEAFGFYPCDYGAATQILLRCERSMVFGGEATVGPWR
ncbi:MAG TPA: aldehyde dehydrogenase, partial [Candidatus Latescibacteria bacterium]|nr:aldehyde dehydrogenase [Candidatus Latescibacterota bacterium]